MANSHLITGVGTTNHIYPEDIGRLYASVTGDGQYVFDIGQKYKATIVSANNITISDGDMLFNGRFVRTTSSVSLNIQNGSQGVKRNDLIVMRYTYNQSDDTEECNLVVVKGTASESPQDPAINNVSIIQNPDVADFPLYRVRLNGISLEGVDKLFNIVRPYGKAVMDGTAEPTNDMGSDDDIYYQYTE